MIESIEFKNFKALRDTTLPLSPCTILVGPNGSGKSTVLQALEAVGSRQGFSREEIINVDMRSDPAARVEVRLNWGEPFQGASRWTRWDGGGPTTGLDAAPADRHVRKKPMEALVAGMRVYSFNAQAIAAPIDLQKDMELSWDGGGLAGVLTRLRDRDGERYEALTVALAQWLPEYDDILFDVDAKGQRLFSLRTSASHQEIPAADLSQGTLLTLVMLTLAHLPEPPSVVGLEEPDRGIHPHLLRRVQDTIYRLSHPDSCGETRAPVQVIATTHSPYLLDLFKDHPEEIVVANKVGGNVQFQQLTDQPHFEDILGDAPLGEAWFTGVLGGVPSGS